MEAIVLCSRSASAAKNKQVQAFVVFGALFTVNFCMVKIEKFDDWCCRRQWFAVLFSVWVSQSVRVDCEAMFLLQTFDYDCTVALPVESSTVQCSEQTETQTVYMQQLIHGNSSNNELKSWKGAEQQLSAQNDSPKEKAKSKKVTAGEPERKKSSRRKEEARMTGTVLDYLLQ